MNEIGVLGVYDEESVARTLAALEALDVGAYDHPSALVRNDLLGQLLTRTIEHKPRMGYEATSTRIDPAPTLFADIVGPSPLVLEAFERVARPLRN